MSLSHSPTQRRHRDLNTMAPLCFFRPGMVRSRAQALPSARSTAISMTIRSGLGSRRALVALRVAAYRVGHRLRLRAHRRAPLQRRPAAPVDLADRDPCPVRARGQDVGGLPGVLSGDDPRQPRLGVVRHAHRHHVRRAVGAGRGQGAHMPRAPEGEVFGAGIRHVDCHADSVGSAGAAPARRPRCGGGGPGRPVHSKCRDKGP